MPRIINQNPVSLANLGRGEVIKRFDEAFDLLLENAKDPRTPVAKPREIIIKVKVSPGVDRDEADLEVAVTHKFAAMDPYSTHIKIGETIHGTIEAHEALRGPEEGPGGVGDETGITITYDGTSVKTNLRQLRAATATNRIAGKAEDGGAEEGIPGDEEYGGDALNDI